MPEWADQYYVRPVFEAETDQSAYEKYIHSGAWLLKREEAFATHGRHCNRCGTTARLQVHHKTYERMGTELMEDLEILCFGCHAEHHRGTGIIMRSERIPWAYRLDEARATRSV